MSFRRFRPLAYRCRLSCRMCRADADAADYATYADAITPWPRRYDTPLRAAADLRRLLLIRDAYAFSFRCYFAAISATFIADAAIDAAGFRRISMLRHVRRRFLFTFSPLPMFLQRRHFRCQYADARLIRFRFH